MGRQSAFPFSSEAEMIETVEQAYEAIGLVLARHAPTSVWTSLVLNAPMHAEQCGGISSVACTDSGDTDIPIGMDIFTVQDAALFLRDRMLADTGHRIYGLLFRLMPDYKFSIQYDYERPDNYVESEGPVDINAALGRLKAIGVNVESGN
jgi:hypothetical protein